ncbi:MAG: ATP-dependent Clp protease adapter ClpS [Magnetococcales bacterium]|nr:ATP-dependent Clp protease adapter ClpS [Magnetococcales bacterium]
MSSEAQTPDSDLLTDSDQQVQEPHLYKVILLNDDFTPMDFVVKLLVDVFRKSTAEATRIMLNVHQQGRGLCGIFPFDIAETKVALVNQHARGSGYPLKCTLERA